MLLYECSFGQMLLYGPVGRRGLKLIQTLQKEDGALTSEWDQIIPQAWG